MGYDNGQTIMFGLTMFDNGSLVDEVLSLMKHVTDFRGKSLLYVKILINFGT